MRIWVAPIERNGPLSEFESLRIISIGILGPAQIRRDGQRYGEGCRCLWGLRILQKRAAEIPLRFEIVCFVLPMVVEHAALIELVSILALLRKRGDTVALEFEQLGLNRARNGADDFVLQLEQVSAAAVISFRPQVRVDVGIDQLGSNADVIPRPSHAAFQHIPHTELTTDLLRADRPVPVRERSMA